MGSGQHEEEYWRNLEARRLHFRRLGHSDVQFPGEVEYWTNVGNVEAVRCAIKDGHSINFLSDTGLTPLHAACQYDDESDMVKLLLESGADIDALSSEGLTALDVARTYANAEVVKILEDWKAAKQ